MALAHPPVASVGRTLARPQDNLRGRPMLAA